MEIDQIRSESGWCKCSWTLNTQSIKIFRAGRKSLWKSTSKRITLERVAQTTFIFDISKTCKKRHIEMTTISCPSNPHQNKSVEVASILHPLKLHPKVHRNKVDFLSFKNMSKKIIETTSIFFPSKLHWTKQHRNFVNPNYVETT